MYNVIGLIPRLKDCAFCHANTRNVNFALLQHEKSHIIIQSTFPGDQKGRVMVLYGRIVKLQKNSIVANTWYLYRPAECGKMIGSLSTKNLEYFILSYRAKNEDFFGILPQIVTPDSGSILHNIVQYC